MMMTPYRTREAKRNLREGIKKMEAVMSPAAQVRRDFQLGRPPKDALPLHPITATDRAESLLADFRTRMQKAKLKPEHAQGVIVGIRLSDPDKPVLIKIDHDEAIAKLSKPDIIALGCVFHQFDEREHKAVTFFKQFTGLNERGLNVLKLAAAKWQQQQAESTLS